MGHFWGNSCGWTLLLLRVVLLPFILNVALNAHGYPLMQNITRVEVDSYTDSVGGEDSGQSSEELVDDTNHVDYASQPKNAYSFGSNQPGRLNDEDYNTRALSFGEKFESIQNKSGMSTEVIEESFQINEEFRNGRSSWQTPQPDSEIEVKSTTSPYDKRFHSRPEMFMDNSGVKLIGLSIDYDSDKRRVQYDDDGSPNILEGMEVTFMLYGQFKTNTLFKFSKFHICDDPKNLEPEYRIRMMNDDDNDGEFTVGTVDVKLPDAGELNEVYICLKPEGSEHFHRQGESKTGSFGLPVDGWLVIKLTTAMLPMYLHVLLIVVLLVLSGLFSGLNLGLMSLDKTDLKIIMNTGSKSEKSYAGSIAPVRNHGNFLLCCLLFSNVLVNATLTILVDDLTTGLIAIAGSTLSIVIFGEIIPQAICSRYGLAVGARTIYITKFFMIVTSPLAYPLSIILDKILGEEIGNIYTRERLKELLKVTKDHHGLETEEVGIISGALDLKLKSVRDVMVRVEHIFMLPSDTVLDFETMAEIEYQGYSRIPVYDGERTNVVALINVRQLTLLDASDNIPLQTIMDYYKTNLFFVFENTRLDYMFKAFREGSKGHMAFVQKVNDEGPGDPYYETVGMLTMEDVLEEILQADIRDENDVGKMTARSGYTKRVAAPYLGKKVKKVVEIPATLALAVTQFLSTSLDPFKYGVVSVSIIQRLVKTNVQFVKAPKHKARQQSPDVFLYENGKPADCFIMILEGRVQVTIGKENLTYEAGPFTAFGNDFLLSDQLGITTPRNAICDSTLSSPVEMDISERPSITSEIADLKRSPTFIPDYSVKLLTDVYFFRIKYEHYRHAVAATELEKKYCNDPDKTATNSEWQFEIDKVLDPGDDEEESKIEEIEMQKTENNEVVAIMDCPNGNSLQEGAPNSKPEGAKGNKTVDQEESHSTEQSKLLSNDIAYS